MIGGSPARVGRVSTATGTTKQWPPSCPRTLPKDLKALIAKLADVAAEAIKTSAAAT